ncbi:MAG: hypothetical protein LBU25_04310 [Treponema sp.]|nr:hypothetical protein [Treponema sp.]
MLTNEIRRDFGLPPVDSSRTEVSEPTGVVRHPPRPEGYNGGVAFFTEGEELIRSRLLIRPKETLTCNETELGAAISMALCRENAKGQQVADTKPGNRLNPQAGPGGGTIPGTSRLRGIVSLCLK